MQAGLDVFAMDSPEHKELKEVERDLNLMEQVKTRAGVHTAGGGPKCNYITNTKPTYKKPHHHLVVFPRDLKPSVFHARKINPVGTTRACASVHGYFVEGLGLDWRNDPPILPLGDLAPCQWHAESDCFRHILFVK